MRQTAIFYGLMLLVSALGLWGILVWGSTLRAPTHIGGHWLLRPDGGERPAPESGVTLLIEQSGQFLGIRWGDGPRESYRMEWPTTASDGTLTLRPSDSVDSPTLLFRPPGPTGDTPGELLRQPADGEAPGQRFTAIPGQRPQGGDAAVEGAQRPIEHPFLLLLGQLAVVIVASRIFGYFAMRLRQPPVIGEMVAGIALGPSLFGWLFPDAFAQVFPMASIPLLGVVAELGVVFFLFVVGLELNPQLLRKRGHAAAAISHASIALPLLLGAAATLLLYQRLFSDQFEMRFTAAALFMGAAMSITAFPVLARILIERNLHRTQVGALAITCAAIDDVSAWCLLAFVVALARADGLMEAVNTTLLATGYVGVMVLVVRPFLRRLAVLHDRQGRLTTGLLAVIVVVLMASSLATAAIGIHALFGAFLAGAIMPKEGRFVRAITERIEPFTLVVLLPVFFAFTGLKTQIGLLSGADLWLMAGFLIAVACLGKFGGSAIAAHFCGMGWRESSAVAILMNTRGLMELVILNIGRQLGVISDAVFAMMVLMALTTTALTSPILDLVYPERLLRAKPGPAAPRRRRDHLLVPISMPASAKALAQMADFISEPDNAQRRIIGLHLRRVEEHEAVEAAVDIPETVSAPLQELQRAAAERSLPLEAVSLASSDAAAEIVQTAADTGVGLVLMGFHKPIIGTTILGGTVHKVMESASCDVAVLVDRGLTESVGSILVPYRGGADDRLALELASTIARSTKAAVTVLHIVPPAESPAGAARQPGAAGKVTSKVFSDPDQRGDVTFKVVETEDPIATVLEHCTRFDLMLIGASEQWGLASQLFSWKTDRIASECPTSMLIVRRGGEE